MTTRIHNIAPEGIIVETQAQVDKWRNAGYHRGVNLHIEKLSGGGWRIMKRTKDNARRNWPEILSKPLPKHIKSAKEAVSYAINAKRYGRKITMKKAGKMWRLMEVVKP